MIEECEWHNDCICYLMSARHADRMEPPMEAFCFALLALVSPSEATSEYTMTISTQNTCMATHADGDALMVKVGETWRVYTQEDAAWVERTRVRLTPARTRADREASTRTERAAIRRL